MKLSGRTADGTLRVLLMPDYATVPGGLTPFRFAVETIKEKARFKQWIDVEGGGTIRADWLVELIPIPVESHEGAETKIAWPSRRDDYFYS